MSGPIKPHQVQKKKREAIPEEVFQVFNDLISQNWDGSSATVLQKDAAAAVAKALKITKSELYDRHLLDVESAYTKAGWHVKYDKPVYYGGEDFEPYFCFSKKR